jgi:hypothetical protein
MVPRRPLPSVFYGLLTMVGVGLAACDKVPLVAPAGTVITLVSSTNVLPINGSADVVAVLIENGTISTGTGTGATTASAGTAVHNGTLVSFTTSLGKIEPAEARTTNGRVTVKLTADGRSGRATITAFSGSASKTLEVVIGAAAAERVAVTASHPLLGANGGESTISARVEDASGNPLFGVPVVFTTTAGTLSSGSGLTGESGVATTILSTTTAATVTASAGGKTSTTAIALKARSTVTVSAPTGVFVGAPALFQVTVGAGADFASVDIQYGDGSSKPLGALSASTTTSYTYRNADSFPVRVVGIDRDGVVTSHSTDVSIVGFSPSMTCSPASGALGFVTTCTVTGVPTTVEIDRYEWFFDGERTEPNGGSSQQHAFRARGERTVRVNIVPSRGPSHSRTAIVVVN